MNPNHQDGEEAAETEGLLTEPRSEKLKLESAVLWRKIFINAKTTILNGKVPIFSGAILELDCKTTLSLSFPLSYLFC